MKMNIINIIAITLSAIQVFAVDKLTKTNNTVGVKNKSISQPIPNSNLISRLKKEDTKDNKNSYSLPVVNTSVYDSNSTLIKVENISNYTPVTTDVKKTVVVDKKKKIKEKSTAKKLKTRKSTIKMKNNLRRKSVKSITKSLTSKAIKSNNNITKLISYSQPITRVKYYNKQYNGHTLFVAVPKHTENIVSLREIKVKYNYNFLNEPCINKDLYMLVRPEIKDEFLDEAALHGVSNEIVFDDIQETLDNQTIHQYTKSNISSFDWEHYYYLGDIYSWMEDLQEYYPYILRVFSIGLSYEGKPILCARIKHKENTRSSVIIEGGIYAREWISPAMVTNLMYRILTAPLENNLEERIIAEMYEWFFIPVLNPDGYQYSMDTDRLWIKNRNLSGVDISRNFDVGKFVATDHPEYYDYPGAKAFSEAESQALANFVKEKSKHLEYYISFHASIPSIMLPFGNTTERLDNYYEVINITKRVIEMFREKYDIYYYTTGTLADIKGYPTFGSSIDWVKQEYRVPYVMSFGLGDQDLPGVLLPPERISSMSDEIFDVLLYVFEPKNISYCNCRVPAAMLTNGVEKIFVINCFTIFIWFLGCVLCFIE